ncbi:hypothetical protein SteCoe_31427 [Stentor coeruleus]|uniref:Uncharacterized protein n=1 Tax=Stentor coeruleus TaxID=5963 RepID=A0A1R2B1B2_9CILI|nr:hypothetical protein SteCoe_31427 [Stentor coeruleus]
MKLLRKTSNQEDEIINLRQELEKIHKDLAYSKKLIEEKNLQINRMESKQKDHIALEIEETYKTANLSFKKFLKKQKKILSDSYVLINCSICKTQTILSMKTPCANSSQCQKSLSREVNCLKCQSPIKKVELSILSDLLKFFKEYQSKSYLPISKN